VEKIEPNKPEKDPVILDFSGDIIDAKIKLESILYTSGWNKYIIVDPDTPSEDMLLFFLIREKAVAVVEHYYAYTNEFTEELRNKAYDYFHRLRKRNIDNIYLNAVNYFSKYEPDIDKTDNGALFYPDINAYIRCGDLSPAKLFELIQKSDCGRVIIFGSTLRLDKEQPWEVFHSFEMQAPKEYIIQKLADLQAEKFQKYYDIIEKSEANKIFPPVYKEKPDK